MRILLNLYFFFLPDATNEEWNGVITFSKFCLCIESMILLKYDRIDGPFCYSVT